MWEVVDAAATKPFGFMRFDPGPGMGGHCLPVDPFYLSWKAREVGFSTEFIELAGKVNQHMPEYCVERVVRALNEHGKPVKGTRIVLFGMSTEFIELAGKVNQQMPRFCLEKIERALNDAGKPVKNARVALIGVSYKAGVGDLREAPALKIIRQLRDLGAEISYHDPHVPELPELGLRSGALDEQIASADLVSIVTAHPEVDHERVVREAKLVVDFRGVTKGIEAPNLVRL